MGLRPHRSMNTKQTQYPGTSPAMEMIILPTQMLLRSVRTLSAVRFCLSASVRPPKPMLFSTMELFKPRPLLMWVKIKVSLKERMQD